MQTESSHRSYRHVPLLILLMTLVILIIGAVALHYVESRLVATTGESLALAAADIADMLDRLLFERYSDIPMMTRARVFQGHNTAAMTDYLNWVQKNYKVYRWLGVLDASGRIIAATSPASLGKDLSRTHLFRVVREQGGVHIQDVEVSEDAGGVPVVSFAGPIVGPRGEFRGAVLTHVGLSVLEDVATAAAHTFQIQRGSAGKIEYQIMSRDGDLIVDSILRQEMQVNLKLLALPSALLSASALPGYIEETHLRRKIPVVTGYAQSDGSEFGEFVSLHWGVLVRMERSDILAPIRTVLWRLAIAGMLIVLPLLGFLLWTSGRLQRDEETLLRQQIEQQVLLDLIPAMVWYKDTRNRIIRANKAAAESINRSIADIEGKSAYELYPDEAEKYYQDDLEVIDSGKPKLGIVELYQTASGNKRWVQTDKVPYRNAQGHIIGVLVFAQDITERKHAEDALERLSHQHELILDGAGEGIYGLDTRGKTTFVNPVAAKMLGWTVDELIGRPMHQILHHTKPDGSPYPEEECPIQAAIKDGSVRRVADDVFWRKDGTSFPVEYVSTPIRERGDVVGAVVVFIDMTLRKQEEERRMQVEKLAALGQVAAGVAHEINNPLAGIKNAFLLLKDAIAPGQPNSQYVSMIDREVQRISDIVRQMYQLYRPDPTESRPIDLEVVLRDVSQIMAGVLRQRRLTLRTEVAPDLPQVRLPQRDLTQVLCNLIRNAIEASLPTGEIRVSVEHDEGTVWIAVADQGEGISAEALPHIFEPFFTTKMGSTQGGMGLGLSVSRSLIEAMGGRIEVQTAVGRGATFTVVLPCPAALTSPGVRSAKEQPHHV